MATDADIPVKEEAAREEDRILMWCSYCGQKYRLRQSLAGKVGACDECHNSFTIPYVSQTKPEPKKTISFHCEHCNEKILKPEELAGSEITCHKCGGKNNVPEPYDEDSPINLLEPFLIAETTRTDIAAVQPAAKTESMPEDSILFWCSHCGQKYRLPRRLDGKSGVCTTCKNLLFIPHTSQTKPELKKTISFPCEHCGKKQLKALELSGTETTCYNCGEKYIIPAKSRKSLVQIVNPINLLEPFLVAETTRTDLPTADDKILFWCSHCGQKYRLPRDLSGKAGICTKCKNYLFIPYASQTEPRLERTVVFPCKFCGEKLRKARKSAGSEVKCGNCGKKVIVPEKSQISLLAPPGAAPEERILFWCGYCGQKYRLPGHLIGKRGTCDKCQKHFVIPPVSQIKPELRKTIHFQCEHCGKELWEDQELAGVEVQCGRCGEENLVPEKSTLSFVQPAADVPDVPQTSVGDPITSVTRPKLFSKPKPAAGVSDAESSSPVSDKVPSSSKPQIIITENPPTIHKLKNYFHRKAEKYFIFAIFVISIDYIIDKCEAGRRPSKAFILFCTFATAAIILLGTWNFVISAPPEKNIESRYNVMCTKCGHREIRRFEDIKGQACSKCRKPMGFTYYCPKCKKYFAYRKSENSENSENDQVLPKCPFCHSDDVQYVIFGKSSPKK